MITDSDLLREKWVKILAPVIDTVLLISAIIQAIKINQFPLYDQWLTAKILALFIYIALGMVALNYGTTKNIKIIAWLASLLCFSYIVAVAMTRNPTVIY